MKVAITINTSWNIYNFRSGLVKQLLQDGHEVHAVAPRDEYSEKLIDWGCIYHPIRVKGNSFNPFHDLSLLVELFIVMRRIKPDIYLGYTIKPNIYGSLVSKILRFPIICNISGLGTVFIWRNWINRVAIWLYKFSIRHASFIFFQNREDRDLFAFRVNVDLSKVGLLPGSGINLEKFRSDNFQPEQFPVFLMIARLIKEKGIYEYVSAARAVKKKYPGVKFKLIGQFAVNDPRGVKPEEVKLWEEEGIIEYLKPVLDIRSVINESEVIVLPSYREGVPRTLLEGGAMSRPLIASDVPGCREVVVDEENGLLCKVKDAKSLTECMIRYISMNDDQKRRFSVNSRRLMEEKFDESIVISRYVEKITDLVSKGPEHVLS